MAAAARTHRQTAAPQPSKRAERRTAPSLRVVEDRSRWPAVVGTALLFVVMAAMLGAAIFHTQLAERQLTIDELEREVQAERSRFDELRRDRALLRSPQRIADEALLLGMVRGDASRFIEIDPTLLAIQIATAGATDDDVSRVIVETDPLDQFRDVKSVSAGQL